MVKFIASSSEFVGENRRLKSNLPGNLHGFRFGERPGCQVSETSRKIPPDAAEWTTTTECSAGESGAPCGSENLVFSEAEQKRGKESVGSGGRETWAYGSRPRGLHPSKSPTNSGEDPVY
jgi:hypothetical protein